MSYYLDWIERFAAECPPDVQSQEVAFSIGLLAITCDDRSTIEKYVAGFPEDRESLKKLALNAWESLEDARLLVTGA